MIPSRVLADLIGLPYELNGRGPDAYDCAGLVIELQRRLGRPMNIPATGDNNMSDHLAMRRILAHNWHTVPRPEPGCVVFFEQEAHVGTVIDGARMLHATSAFGQVFIERMDTPEWRGKRRSYWLPKEDACPA